MKEKFDIYQGHGDHIDTINGYNSSREFLERYIPSTIQSADMVLRTRGTVECSIGESGGRLPIALLGDRDGPVRLLAMIATEAGRSNVISFYPECDGAPAEVRLTAVHEWAAGVEATLEGTVFGDAERSVAFFDTRYVLNKGRYKVGETYTFRLAAFAYCAEVVPEKDREIRFEGDAAAEMRLKLGDEPEFEEDGSVKPVIFSTEDMVLLFQNSAAYPDDGEFQSPVFDAPMEFGMFGTDFYMMEIAIARDSEDVRIPLVARQSFFTRKPVESDPVRGRLWVQGYLADGDYREGS